MDIAKPREQVDFELNRRLLNRYRFVEQETLRMLAGWLPATARMELKLAMGRWLWEDAQHVQQFYQRLKEVQKPAFQSTGDSGSSGAWKRLDTRPMRWRSWRALCA